MTIPALRHLEYRCSDVDAALRWYETAVFGVSTFTKGQATLSFSQLPSPLAARGVPAHWLGHVGVEDFDASLGRWLDSGAQALGLLREQGGVRIQTLRTPGGEVFALRSASTLEGAHEDRSLDVLAWSELHCLDVDASCESYGSTFGWSGGEAYDPGLGIGRYQTLRVDAEGSASIGVVATAQLAQVHAHWLFYWRVDDLDATVKRLEADGGRVTFPPRTRPDSMRVVSCEDPFGAAVGFAER